jgi:ChrR Cupin-like domain
VGSLTVPATPNRSLIGTCTPHLASTAWISALQWLRSPTSFARARDTTRRSDRPGQPRADRLLRQQQIGDHETSRVGRVRWQESTHQRQSRHWFDGVPTPRLGGRADHINEDPAAPIENGDLLQTVVLDHVPPEELQRGITKRRLPSSGEVVMRVFDMAPGIRWPEVDLHDRDELIYVVSGELIEGDQCYPAGTYLHYKAGSRHQPRTEMGVRILVAGPAHP